MDFVTFSAIFRVVAFLWTMYAAGETQAPIVLPEPQDQFAVAFPSIAEPPCVQHYQYCRGEK